MLPAPVLAFPDRQTKNQNNKIKVQVGIAKARSEYLMPKFAACFGSNKRATLCKCLF